MDKQSKTIPEMLREYNALAVVAANLGLSYRERKCFKDRSDATKSLEMINSSLRAAKEAAAGSPGRQRLLESGKAEEIRQQVLQDQEKAAAGAAADHVQPQPEAVPPAQTTEKVSTIMAKVKKDKAEGKTNGNGRRGRESAFKDEMKIAVLTDKNPKREGSRGHEVFGHYRNGMLVKTFVEKVGDRGEAMANLRYDSGKEFISVA